MTTIRIRKGTNGFRYSVCDDKGRWFGNFEKLSDIRKHWKEEIKRGQVQLIRELDQLPDTSLHEGAKKALEGILKSHAQKNRGK